MPAPVCCSSFSCHTQTSRDTRWRKGWMHKSKSWLILQRSCPFLPELSLEVCCHVKPSLVLSKCYYWYIHNISVYNLLYVRANREKTCSGASPSRVISQCSSFISADRQDQGFWPAGSTWCSAQISFIQLAILLPAAIRFCDRCQVLKPDRCHHCSVCET